MKTDFNVPPGEAENPVVSASLIGELGRGSLTAVQDYHLIMLAIDRGMSKQDIATAQGVCVHHLRRKMRILKRISGEVATLFEDVRITNPTFDVLGKMTERRQVEVANMMIATGNYSCEFATALLAATPPSDLVKPPKVSGVRAEQMAEIAREMAALQHDRQQVATSHGNDMLRLAIATAYLKKLISNSEIEGYLGRHHPDLLEGFRVIVASGSGEHR